MAKPEQGQHLATPSNSDSCSRFVSRSSFPSRYRFPSPSRSFSSSFPSCSGNFGSLISPSRQNISPAKGAKRGRSPPQQFKKVTPPPRPLRGRSSSNSSSRSSVPPPRKQP